MFIDVDDVLECKRTHYAFTSSGDIATVEAGNILLVVRTRQNIPSQRGFALNLSKNELIEICTTEYDVGMTSPFGSAVTYVKIVF